MKFNTFGNPNNPIIIMLTGSFCPAESMENLYSKLCDDFYIVAPTYNGHYEGSKDFTTRQNEAAEIRQYLKEQQITSVKLVYGQSMGSEIGIELMSQLVADGITVENVLFDGAPCIKLSKVYKAFMLFKFRTLIKMLRGKTVEDAMNIPLIKKFSGGDPEALKPMIEPIIKVAPYLNDNSIRNEVECCYTFDFPQFDTEMQKRMHFFYDKDEKACRTCLKLVQKAYPQADYRIVSGHGHLTYCCKHTGEYIDWIKEICE